MKLEVLTDVVIDALVLSGEREILASIVSDSSADNIERQAYKLPPGPLQIGLMHYGDVIRVWGLRQALARVNGRPTSDRHAHSNYEMCKAVDCLTQIPGVEISDDDKYESYPEKEYKSKPIPVKPAYKAPEFPAQNEGEDLFDWLYRCPLWAWVNFNLERDIPDYQNRKPTFWVDSVLRCPWYSDVPSQQRVIARIGADNYEGGKYVKIFGEVLTQSVASGLMVLSPEQKYSETIDTYVLAEKYAKK